MFRHRTLFLIGGSLLVLAALLWTDPDKGLTTGMLLLALVVPVIAVAFAHWARKALFDYPEADAQALFRTAAREPTGAGLALVAISIVLAALIGLFGRQAHAAGVDLVRTQIPQQAEPWRGLVAAEMRAQWPDHPLPGYVPALIEHESGCPGLRAKCWNPKSQLKTAREEGAGLGQITRAWSPDGRLRFDALAEMRDAHPALAALDWSTIYSRPDLQVRALILKTRDDWHALRMVADPAERLAFADAAYNGGMGGVQKERRACAQREGCDPGRWWDHVERLCLKSRAPLYGTRSACDINRHHVVDVIRHRAPKYRGWI